MSLLFYDRHAGEGEIYTADGQGNICLLASYSGWRTSWTHIIPCYATNQGQSITLLLFYDSSSGVAQFYSVDNQGTLAQLSSSTYSTGWTHIIPGTFAASPNTALLFYNSTSGLARFYSTDGQGGIQGLSSSAYSKGWTHIAAGSFATNGYTALLFYNGTSGLAQFYSTDGQGGIQELSSSTYSKGWTHIVVGGFTATGGQGLLFYNGTSGLAQFYSTDGQGGIHQLSSSTYSKGWTHIVDVIIPTGTGVNYNSLLFYNGTSGLAQFYNTDGQGGIHQLSSTTYRTGWAQIQWMLQP